MKSVDYLSFLPDLGSGQQVALSQVCCGQLALYFTFPSDNVRLQVTGYRLQVTGYRLQVKNNRSGSTSSLVLFFTSRVSGKNER